MLKTCTSVAKMKLNSTFALNGVLRSTLKGTCFQVSLTRIEVASTSGNGLFWYPEILQLFLLPLSFEIQWGLTLDGKPIKPDVLFL